jgi:hypothetical protein
MENLLRRQLFGDEVPSAPSSGDTDRAPDPVAQMIHEQQYGIRVPGSSRAARPAQKAMSVEEIEKQLHARRQERRKALCKDLLGKHPEIFAAARIQIRESLQAERDECIAAGGDPLKLFAGSVQ